MGYISNIEDKFLTPSQDPLSSQKKLISEPTQSFGNDNI